VNLPGIRRRMNLIGGELGENVQVSIHLRITL
jgi:hypothetical protein